jgi:DoxX-like family
MTRSKKIIFWVATIWLSLGMFSTGLVQLLHRQEEVELMVRLGYPVYFLSLLGVWKILGVAAVLSPRLPLLKEWAYAGFFFAMTGAVYAHVASGSAVNEIFPSLLLLLLTIVSWYYRQADRRLIVLSGGN